MKKDAGFANKSYDYWPDPETFKPYFFKDPPWFSESGNDSAGFTLDDDHLRIDLYINGDPRYGVAFIYRKWDGAPHYFYSKGDVTRLSEHVSTTHDDLMPRGIYIPFDQAWLVVKEFLENEGALPTCIAWLRDEDLPRDAFPPP